VWIIGWGGIYIYRVGRGRLLRTFDLVVWLCGWDGMGWDGMGWGIRVRFLGFVRGFLSLSFSLSLDGVS